MAVLTLTTSPIFPAEGDAITLTATGDLGTTFVFEITSVPPTSTVSLGFLASRTLTAAETAGPIADTAQSIANNDIIGNSFTADVAGEYGISVYEFTETLGFTAGHDTDPSADARFDLRSIGAFTIDVGVNMDLPIRTAGDDAVTLRLQVVGSTIRVASIVDALTEKSRVAALQSAVTAALTALVGVAVSALGADLQTNVNDLRTVFNAHRAQIAGPDSHSVADTVNTVRVVDALSQNDAIDLLNETRAALIGHLRDSSSQGAGLRWHEHVTNADDLKNGPVVDEARTLAEATVLLSELRFRVYDRHRLEDDDTPGEAPVHDEEDTANTLASSATLLDDAIIAYLDAIAEVSPTTPTGEPPGAQELTHRYGFTRVIPI